MFRHTYHSDESEQRNIDKITISPSCSTALSHNGNSQCSLPTQLIRRIDHTYPINSSSPNIEITSSYNSDLIARDIATYNILSVTRFGNNNGCEPCFDEHVFFQCIERQQHWIKSQQAHKALKLSSSKCGIRSNFCSVETKNRNIKEKYRIKNKSTALKPTLSSLYAQKKRFFKPLKKYNSRLRAHIISANPLADEVRHKKESSRKNHCARRFSETISANCENISLEGMGNFKAQSNENLEIHHAAMKIYNMRMESQDEKQSCGKKGSRKMKISTALCALQNGETESFSLSRENTPMLSSSIDQPEAIHVVSELEDINNLISKGIDNISGDADVVDFLVTLVEN